MGEADKRSPSIPAEQEESISMVQGNDNNEDVDPDDDVQIPGIPEPPKAS